MTYERITADQIEAGDRIAAARTHPFLTVEAIESIGASSRYIRLAGNERIRPRHTAKFWREALTDLERHQRAVQRELREVGA